MIDETTTRRGFLKGLGAAVALLTVAPPLLMHEVVAAAPEALLPAIEPSEFWLRMAGRWRLIGAMQSLTTHREIEEDDDDFENPFVSFRHVGPLMFSTDLVVDPTAADDLHEVHLGGGPVDVAVGFGDVMFDLPGARLQSYSLTATPTHALASVSGTYETARCRR